MDNPNYSQITFEFSDVPTDQGIMPSLGVRVKSLKNDTETVDAVAAVEAVETVMKKKEEPAPVKQPEVVKKSTRGRKSLKALDAEADLVNIPADEILFQRQYYSIGEVADMFRVNQSLLRFWENEFDIIQPRKNRKGDRHFRPIDIKNLELIYDLLRRRKLTIEGAKDFIKKNSRAKEHFEMIQSLQSLKGFLLEIKAAL
jgi:DNA-binding transcriptional MerR regulator